MADNSISTVLSLSLHPSPGICRPREPKPGVDLCPSVWCFNPIKPKEESLISSKPNLQDLTFNLLSSPTHTTHHSSVLDLFPVSDLTAKKRRRVEKDNNRNWIKKRLSLSDVNESSRLLLPKEDIKNYVLPLLDEKKCADCQSMEGLGVKIWDLDTKSEHNLSFKQWKNGSFILVTNWSTEFVKRRSLKEGDCIGLLWDSENLGFFFHKFNSQ